MICRNFLSSSDALDFFKWAFELVCFSLYEGIKFVCSGQWGARACRCRWQSKEPLLVLFEGGVARHIDFLFKQINYEKRKKW